MITGIQVAYEEMMRILRSMVPLALLSFAVFAAAGCGIARSGVSLLLGACCSLLRFGMIGRNAASAALYPPAQGIRIVRRGYFIRYLLTGAAVFAAIKTPFIQPAAAVLPLFFPKVILLWPHVFQQKGG